MNNNKGLIAILILNIVIGLFVIWFVYNIKITDDKIYNNNLNLLNNDIYKFQDKVELKYKLNRKDALTWSTICYNAATKFELKTGILLSIAKNESNFKCGANSYIKTSNKHDGSGEKEFAQGAYQIKPSTAKPLCEELGIKYYEGILYDPIVSSKICAFYIKKLLILFDNNLEAAIKAYNVGPYNYRRSKYKEAQNKYWKNFKKEYIND